MLRASAKKKCREALAHFPGREFALCIGSDGNSLRIVSDVLDTDLDIAAHYSLETPNNTNGPLSAVRLSKRDQRPGDHAIRIVNASPEKRSGFAAVHDSPRLFGQPIIRRRRQ